MAADTPKTSPQPAQDQLDTARAQYAADYDMARARVAGAKARRIAENDALNKIQPDQGKEAKVQ
jgi:hypothetical protein